MKFSGSLGSRSYGSMLDGSVKPSSASAVGASALPASEEGAHRRYGQNCPAGSNYYCPDNSYSCEYPGYDQYCPNGESECCFPSSPTPTPTPPTPTPTPYPRPTSDGNWVSYSECADLSDECKICEQSGKASLAFSVIATAGALVGSLIVLCRSHEESTSSAYTCIATCTLIAALVGWLAWFACFAQLVKLFEDVPGDITIFPTTGSWAMALAFIITAALTCAERKRLRMARCMQSSDREHLVIIPPPVIVHSQPYSNVPSQALPPPPPQVSKTSPWTEYADPEGKTYYHNSETGVTQWDRPQW